MANQPTRILVVDDDDALRITLVDLLEFDGLDVSSAIDGVQAVEMATTSHYDLILMDVRMPGIEGSEACRQIKMISPETIIIMMTGHPNGLLEDALVEGAYAVLYKPLDLENLARIVRPAVGSTCVLVVDDDPEAREMLREVLEENGFQVSVAVDGKQAINKAGEKHYDVILMDAVMPVMGGVNACQKIVEDDPDARVIFLTGYSVANLVKRALSAGAFSMLEKPVMPDQLISLLRSIVGRDTTEAEGSHKQTQSRIE